MSLMINSLHPTKSLVSGRLDHKLRRTLRVSVATSATMNHSTSVANHLIPTVDHL